MTERHDSRGARARAAAAAALVIVGAALGPSSAHAAEAYFPGDTPPPTQITRDLTLKEAAQRGLIKLESKGLGGEGDAVSLELQHKKVRGPITVTLKVEFTVRPRVTPENQQKVREALPTIAGLTEAELNGKYRTRDGDPIRFKFEWAFRSPAEPPRFNYHQVLLVNPEVDLDEPQKDYRSRLEHRPIPNRFGESSTGTFSALSFNPTTLAHEMLHLAGLDDRYADFYRVGGKDYPLPDRGLSPSQVAAFAKAHRPRLPLPPKGKVITKNAVGVKRCDIMGTGAYKKCRRISRTDLDWFESQAGVQVTVQPGDLLLNKDPERQNMAVGFTTKVYATPGSTTTANGISVYCIDKDLLFPVTESFDVLGNARELPGYEPLAALLELSGRVQPSLEETPPGMLNAVWNVTDAAPLEFSGSAEESRALLAQAGVAEDGVPGGLAYLANPNAGASGTGAVTGGEVQPEIASAETPLAAQTRLGYAQLYPARLRAGRRVRADLLYTLAGDASRVTLVVQRRAGRRWRKVRSLRPLRAERGQGVAALKLGRLARGKHRLVVSAAGSFGPPSSMTAPFDVR